MAEFGIIAHGAYVPRLRLDRKIIAEAHRWMAPGLGEGAKGARAFRSWDEDCVTMAVEAARDGLRGADARKIASVTVASTTFPYADLQHSAIVADALRLPSSVRSLDMASSQRAGVSALLQALRMGEESLVIASDAPVGKPGSARELSFGAGAAAFALGRGEPLARLVSCHSRTVGFVDHFRPAGEPFDYFWEDRWVRDEGYLALVPPVVEAALREAQMTIGDVKTLVMPSMLRGAAPAVARQMGFKGALASDLDKDCGYSGAAHALLMFSAALDEASPGERILLVGFGQGVDALVFEVGKKPAPIAGRRGVAGALKDALPTDSYLRMLSFYGNIELEWGMRAEKVNKTALTEQYRSSHQTAGFVAGRCRACGAIQFPQLQYCVTPTCRAGSDQFDQLSLVDAPAKLLTHTADWLSYHPAPPLHVGFVQFDNGARLMMEVVDVGPGWVEPGAPLRMVMRVKERDAARGYVRYFWKSTPLDIG